jgi:hypothetical protein
MKTFVTSCLFVSLLTLFAVDQLATETVTHSGTQRYIK